MKKNIEMIVIPSYVCKYFCKTSVFLQDVADIHNPRYLLSKLGWNRFLQFFEYASKPLYHFHSEDWSKNWYKYWSTTKTESERFKVNSNTQFQSFKNFIEV